MLTMINCETQQGPACIGAKVFDRKTLQFTVKLLRKPNPYKSNNQFPLQLDSFTLKRIIETIAIISQEVSEKNVTAQKVDELSSLQAKDRIEK